LRLFIQQNLVYPKAALEAKVAGKVFVKYVVDESGNVIETKVIHGLGYGCDEEAARIVKLFKFNVKKTRGLKLKHNKRIRIHFDFTKVRVKMGASNKFSKLSYTTIGQPAKNKKTDNGQSYNYEIDLP